MLLDFGFQLLLDFPGWVSVGGTAMPARVPVPLQRCRDFLLLLFALQGDPQKPLDF